MSLKNLEFQPRESRPEKITSAEIETVRNFEDLFDILTDRKIIGSDNIAYDGNKIMVGINMLRYNKSREDIARVKMPTLELAKKVRSLLSEEIEDLHEELL